jgi:hypothetical protein
MGSLFLSSRRGQFVVLRLHLDLDKPPVLRSYSLSDLPAADHFRISVKSELNDMLALLLKSVSPGYNTHIQRPSHYRTQEIKSPTLSVADCAMFRMGHHHKNETLRVLIFRRLFGVVDDEHLHGFSLRLQFQAELLLKGCQERRAVGIGGRFRSNRFTRLL